MARLFRRRQGPGVARPCQCPTTRLYDRRKMRPEDSPNGNREGACRQNRLGPRPETCQMRRSSAPKQRLAPLQPKGNYRLRHIPAVDITKRAVHAPHLVIVGAGASIAATPNGDLKRKPLPSMINLVDYVGLAPLLDRTGINWKNRNFEDVYDELTKQRGLGAVLREIKQQISRYFGAIEIPREATAYDYLLLCLREKDAIATFNWDPLLPQAYLRNAHLRRLPSIFFLHGNVAVGYCLPCKAKYFISDVYCRKCRKRLSPTKLLYPARNKQYGSDPFIDNEWKELRIRVEHAYLLTIFGYSAPNGDAAAIDLMRSAWEKNGTKELAQVEIVDIKSVGKLHQTWSSFITRQHYHATKSLRRSLLSRYPRRTCEAFFWASLQNDPWEDNYIPRLRNLNRLQKWVERLVRKEDDLEKSGKPLS